MKQIKSEDTRKMIDYALGVQNKEKNVPILESLAKKKHQLALILGYNSFSEFILEDRMAKTPQTVADFEDKLTKKIQDQGAKEKQVLIDLKRNLTGDPSAEFYNWDSAYYKGILEKQNFQIDEESLKEFFPSDHVKNATLSIYQELLGLKFRELPNA